MVEQDLLCCQTSKEISQYPRFTPFRPSMDFASWFGRDSHMPQLLTDGRFLDFGSSAFLAQGVACRCVRVVGIKPSALRAQIKLLAPRRPGVYGMLDAEEQLIYVGKAKNLRIRLQSYFRRKGRPAKA